MVYHKVCLFLGKFTTYLPRQTMKQVIYTEKAPKAVGPYSQAIHANGFLYISGQIPIDPSTGTLVDEDIRGQTLQVMKNIGAILEAAGYDYSHVVKSTCLLTTMDHFSAMNEVYGSFYPTSPPARAAYAVVKLPLGVLIEIETIAYKPQV